MATVFPGNTGQLSLALSHTVSTKSKSCLANSSTLLERWPDISIPISCMTAIASGRTWLGLVPALNTSKRFPASCRKRPSAIWLRAELPVQRIKIRFLSGMSLLRRHKPAKKQRSGSRTGELGNDEAGDVHRPDTRESVGSRARQSDSGIGE